MSPSLRHLAALALGAALVGCAGRGRTVQIGSKAFTESYVLAEIAVAALEQGGVPARHRPGMGGTIILWEALRTGAIDAYPDYTGTIASEILGRRRGAPLAELRAALAGEGISITAPLGFDNSYALVMRRAHARALGITSIGDLRAHPELRVALTHEFIGRGDGWRPLAATYGLEMTDVVGIEHALAYGALARGEVDVIDAYTTDARLATLDLVALTDDLEFFPSYEAVFLYRADIGDGASRLLRSLAGTIDEARMVALNAAAERFKDYRRAAALFAGGDGVAQPELPAPPWRRIAGWTARHLELVGVSLLLAVLAGVPLGIAASRGGLVGQVILAVTGMLYTVPSLALLAALAAVPFLGIGTRTAIVALFLYSLLPIVRNTAVGLQSIPAPVRESAAALGLEPRAQLLKVSLPMAFPTILAGIKTSAVINVATATLAALIGVGGLGEPIISGLNLNDPATIMQGAIPAALLALAVQLGFDALERLVTPRGLRLPAGGDRLG